MLLKQYYPCAYVESALSIDYQKLYGMGYRALIFDIDNTLAHHGEDPTEEVDRLFEELHRIGFKTLLLSNNGKDRIERFLRNIDSPYIEEAGKPDTSAYAQALEMLALPREQVICIGDQVFTDIRGANRSGLDSILVKYMRYPDEKKIGIRRRLEKIILLLYRFSPSRCRDFDDIQREGDFRVKS